MIKFTKPKFTKTFAYLEKLERFDPINLLNKYGRLGVGALARATPKDTGEAASSWSYKIEGNRKLYKLFWTNNDMAGRVPLVVLLQYGHATKSGYFISGIDFINPALKPLVRSLARELGQEVSK